MYYYTSNSFSGKIQIILDKGGQDQQTILSLEIMDYSTPEKAKQQAENLANILNALENHTIKHRLTNLNDILYFFNQTS